jgi:putative sugar O-methyltransferase
MIAPSPGYPQLDAMLADMRQQPALYQPTSFWDDASRRIVSEIRELGLDEFRRLPTPQGFFVPTYGTPNNRFSATQIAELETFVEDNYPDSKMALMGLRQFLSGEAAALADYRVLLAGDDASQLPYLHRFSESTVGAPVEQFVFENRRFSRSSLNYLLGLALLKKHIGKFVPSTVLEIGGGFGTLGEILAASEVPGLRYLDLDIPPTIYVAQHYLAAVLGETRVATYAQTRDAAEIEIESLPIASTLCAWQIERLRGSVDLFVNFISFQEMEPAVVKNYLHHVSRLNARWILLRNLREGHRKRPPDGRAGVDEPILGDDYLAMLPQYELVDRQVHPFGYRTVDGFNSELLLLRRKA